MAAIVKIFFSDPGFQQSFKENKNVRYKNSIKGKNFIA